MENHIYTITGEYKVDQSRIPLYYKKSRETFVKRASVSWLLMLIFLFSMSRDLDMIYFALYFTGTLALAGVIWFSRIDGVFESTKIIFDDYRIKREGKDLVATFIYYKDIGKIIIQPRGIILIEKGFFSYFRFYGNRSALTLLDCVIFIPCMIKDYDMIKDFLQKKKRFSIV
jgi:hypothetical protein